MRGRHASVRPTRASRPWVPAVIALVGALGLTGGLGTRAYWNDSTAVSGTTLTSGSLDVRVGGQDSYTWSALSMTNLAPGESTADSLTISNAGTTPFTVSITSTVASSSSDIRTAMLATIRSNSSASTTSASYPRTESCSGTNNITYGPAALPATTTTVLGPSSSLAPGDTLTFCVLLELPSPSTNATQDQTYSPTFVVTATQVSS